MPPPLLNALLRRLLLALFALALPCAALAAKYQTIAQLAGPDGEFIIDALPYNPNEAGSSAVHVRYRYRGIRLSEVPYRSPDDPLYAYLRQDATQVRDLGLSTESQWRQPRSYPTRGPTLYLPPSQFSAAEVDRLAAFIRKNQSKLRTAFHNVDIHGSFLRVIKTKTRVRFDGIARLVHADLPFVDFFSGDWLLIVIHHDGNVTLTNSYKGPKHPPQVVNWGHHLPPRRKGGKPRLLLRPVTIEKDKPCVYDSALMKKWARYLYKDARRLRDIYDIQP